MEEKKKYEILPGVELPDMKAIREAASDFSISDVGDVDIKQRPVIESSPITEATTPAVSPEELARLQSLGQKVAEDEARAQAESRKKMDAIMSKAVHASESISDLQSSNIQKANEEKRKELEDSLKAEADQKAEEEAKNKAREERRLLQQRLFEEAKERAAKEKEAAAEAARELGIKIEEDDELPVEDILEEVNAETAEKAPVAEQPAETKEEPKAETEVKQPLAAEVKPERFVKDEKKAATIASAEETFDDFKEFLGDDDDKE